MKLISALAALTLIAAPVQAGNQSDYQDCLKLRAQLNELQAGMGDKSTNCKKVQNWKSPAERQQAAGGRTALIRKCEGIWKPQLKSQRSYSYKKADISMAANTTTVKVHYTAKNSFNARVPGTFTCNFGG